MRLLIDYDNDGDLDLTSFNEISGTMRFFENLSVVPEPTNVVGWLVIVGLWRSRDYGGAQKGHEGHKAVLGVR